jgi:hypothetical protein
MCGHSAENDASEIMRPLRAATAIAPATIKSMAVVGGIGALVGAFADRHNTAPNRTARSPLPRQCGCDTEDARGRRALAFLARCPSLVRNRNICDRPITGALATTPREPRGRPSDGGFRPDSAGTAERAPLRNRETESVGRHASAPLRIASPVARRRAQVVVVVTQPRNLGA